MIKTFEKFDWYKYKGRIYYDGIHAYLLSEISEIETDRFEFVQPYEIYYHTIFHKDEALSTGGYQHKEIQGLDKIYTPKEFYEIEPEFTKAIYKSIVKHLKAVKSGGVLKSYLWLIYDFKTDLEKIDEIQMIKQATRYNL